MAVQDEKVEKVTEEEAVTDIAGDSGSKEEKKKIIHDHPIFKKVEDGDLESVQNLIEVEGVSVEILDQHGMTPLMHAAWKGTEEVAEYLLKQGADANGGRHDHNYTCLHFAGLAGKPEICRMLLETGAKAYHTNSVNRTAASMAAFVGNHGCVSVINNFVPKDDIWYYTRKQPFESEAKLPIHLAKPLYRIAMSMNTNPVRVGMIFKEEPKMLQEITKVRKVLELLCDKEFKSRNDVNEILSLKYHILHYIVKAIEKEKEKDEKKEGEKKTPFIDRWIKSMLLGRDTDGFPVYQENFLRQGIKEFPFQESTLFKMLVTNFAQCKNYGEGQTASEYINGAFNGQKGFKDFENCDTCGEEKAEKKCSSCKSADYCNQTCQKLHWFQHKKHCAALKIKHDKMAAAAKEAKDKEEKEKAEKEKEDNAKVEEEKKEKETSEPSQSPDSPQEAKS